MLLCVLLISAAAQAQQTDAPPSAVPTPAAVALGELHRMQLREPELWREREKYCVGCGVAALATGIPIAASMLTTGGIWFAVADQEYGFQYDSRPDDASIRRDRAIGMAMILLGLAGAGAAFWGARKIARERRPRNAALAELRIYAERRTLLETILSSYLAPPQ
jgi:hypothetical protein